jgi:hypothetical protein
MPTNPLGAFAWRDRVCNVPAPNEKVISLWRVLASGNELDFAKCAAKMYQTLTALHPDSLKILRLLCHV